MVCTTQTAHAAQGAALDDPVLLLSIDGLGYDRLLASRARLPNLRRLLQRGAAGPLRTVFPSLTWPAHASLLSGREPAKTGVIGNRWFDRASMKVVQAWQLDRREALRGDTLLEAAHRAGWTSAVVLWPLTSRLAAAAWVLPEVYGERAMRKAATPGFVDELQAAGFPTDRLDRLTHEEAFELDSFSRDVATMLIERHRPRLLLLHLLSYDTMAHRYGPDARPATWALELCDRYLGDVLAAYHEAGLSARLHVVVVSDHGFAAVHDGLSSKFVVQDAALSRKESAQLELVHNGHTLWVYDRSPKRDAHKAMKKLLERLQRDERVEQIWGPETIAQLGLGDPRSEARAPDAVVLVRPEVMLWNPKRRARERKPTWRGMHGTRPERPEMHGVFVAAGPRFAHRRRLDSMRVIDVAPTLAAAFGLQLEGPVDGQARRDALRRATTTASPTKASTPAPARSGSESATMPSTTPANSK
ncbi:MAG: hypothetical protein RIT45_1057 [Pseudomonadota bacterium]